VTVALDTARSASNRRFELMTIAAMILESYSPSLLRRSPDSGSNPIARQISNNKASGPPVGKDRFRDVAREAERTLPDVASIVSFHGADPSTGSANGVCSGVR